MLFTEYIATVYRWQQPKEQFFVSDAMDLRDLGCRVMQAHSYKALSPSPGTLWSDVMSRPSRAPSTQSVPSSDVIDMDE